MKKLLSITVEGKENTYSFTINEDPKYLEEWREDGLIIDEVINVVPLWVIDAGLIRPWCFIQDIINFKNPFKWWK